MKKIASLLSAFAVALFLPGVATTTDPALSFSRLWTYNHAVNQGQSSEIPAFDPRTNTLWVAGGIGVDVLDAATGSLVQHINTTASGSINSVAIHEGLAAFAIEATTRTAQGVVVFYDTKTRALASGRNVLMVGALPDMLTFTPDGRILLVANEGTPTTYGARVGNSVPRVFQSPVDDPPGSVTIIDVKTRSIVATAGLTGVPVSGSNVRTNTGMDFEPEYIAVNRSGTRAYVTLQEANAVGILDLKARAFTRIVGLGAKDFSLPGNQLDPDNDGKVSFISANVKGLYMPDSIAAYESGGRTYLVTANEGDFREDDADRSAAGSLGAEAPLANLRVSNTDSSPGNLFAAGARSMSIRDDEGRLVWDSGDLLDKKAAELGIYNDARSRDKGVEPEGLALLEIGGRTYAFVGLERTTRAAVAVFDISNPQKATFVHVIVTDGDVAPEGLVAFHHGGHSYLAIANEVSHTTTLYRIDRR